MRNAAYPSPTAHRVRASQYDSAESDGFGESGCCGVRFRVPSASIHRATLPALGPAGVLEVRQGAQQTSGLGQRPTGPLYGGPDEDDGGPGDVVGVYAPWDQ